MNVLVLGGTRFLGVHMVNTLLKNGHKVTIATRGKAKDSFGGTVERLIIERTNPESLSKALSELHFDAACDNIAYSSNEVKYLLDTADISRYVLTSSASVYDNVGSGLGVNTAENSFDPLTHKLVWCSQKDFAYDEIKRQAECALFQAYSNMNAAAVRFPYVTGVDDYTNRLYFYVEHIVKKLPINVDNLDAKIGFIHSQDAGAFLAWLAGQSLSGPVNAASPDGISISEIIQYVEGKTGIKAVVSPTGDSAPYNGDASFSLTTQKAESMGYEFPRLESWFYKVLDRYIETAKGLNNA